MTDAPAIPAEVLEPSPPLTDDDLDRLGEWAEATAAEIGSDVVPLAREAMGWEGNTDLPERVVHWRIDGDRTAAWAMAKLRDYVAQRAAIMAQAEEWIANIRSWAKVELASRRIESSVAYFEAQLERYALVKRVYGGPATLRLPTGTVPTRKAAPKVVVTDDKLVIEWAKAVANRDRFNWTDVVNVKESVSLTGLREVTTIAEVVDEARLTFTCGCILDWTPDAEPALELPGLGDGVTCPGCGADALTGNVEVVVSHLVAVDDHHEPVPGVMVEGEIVTAKVVPDA